MLYMVILFLSDDPLYLSFFPLESSFKLCFQSPNSPLFPIFATMNRLAWILLAVLAACGERAAQHSSDTTSRMQNAPSPVVPPTVAQQPPLHPPSAADTTATSPARDTAAAVLPLPNNQIFTATVDGTEWGGVQVIASRVDSAIAVTAIGPNGTSLILNLGKRSAPGQLKFGAADPGQFATWINTHGVSFSTEPAGSGNVRITHLDNKRVKGTFSFNAAEEGGKGTVQIAKGRFDVMFGK